MSMGRVKKQQKTVLFLDRRIILISQKKRFKKIEPIMVKSIKELIADEKVKKEQKKKAKEQKRKEKANNEYKSNE